MPIFAFQIGVGFKKTSSKIKYFSRMFLLGLISEIPFLLMLSAANFIPALIPENITYFSLNICFTFSIALATLYFIELGKKNPFFYVVSLFLALLSLVVPMDYGIWAVLIVILSYFYSDKKVFFCIGALVITGLYYFLKAQTIQIYMLLALPFIFFYNKTKGKPAKYLFYIFYPLHMLIIALLCYLM